MINRVRKDQLKASIARWHIKQISPLVIYLISLFREFPGPFVTLASL